MYDSDEDMVELKVRREYENLGYPVNNNERENDEPFTRDRHGFKPDSETYKRCFEMSSKYHGKFLSYEEACKANELNENRDPLDVKNDISSLYTCIYCDLIFTHPKRYIIHYKWHSFGATTEAIDASSVVPKKKKKVKVEEPVVEVKKEDEENKSYECDVCNQIYRSKRSLHNHRSRQHLISPKICPVCNKIFSSDSALASHMQSHQQPQQANRFMCSQCPKTFKFMHSLQRHIPTHLEDKAFPCSGCDKSFGSDLLLKIHAKTHLKPMKGKGFSCAFCPKTFYQAFSMQAHSRTHTGERPFPCGLCKQKYPTNSSLSRHLKVSHGGALPFQCQLCGKSFHVRSAWDYHMRRSHLKERPHVCQECGHAFSCRSQLVNHYKKHHEKVDDSMLIGHSVDEAPSVVKKRKQRRKRKEYSDDSA